jgi:hypothetical protein
MPQVEDMTSNIVVGSACDHKTLFFGAGGRVVICSQCSARWENMAQEYIEVDLNEDDRRVDPDTLVKGVPEGGIPEFLREVIEKALNNQGYDAAVMTMALDNRCSIGVAHASIAWSPQDKP